jgi:hypothetical protein
VPPEIFIAATVVFISKLQVPVPLLLKYTTSDDPGTDAPPAPPDVADQLAVLFQLEDDDEIQNLFAEYPEICSKTNKINMFIFNLIIISFC